MPRPIGAALKVVDRNVIQLEKSMESLFYSLSESELGKGSGVGGGVGEAWTKTGGGVRGLGLGGDVPEVWTEEETVEVVRGWRGGGVMGGLETGCSRGQGSAWGWGLKWVGVWWCGEGQARRSGVPPNQKQTREPGKVMFEALVAQEGQKDLTHLTSGSARCKRLLLMV